MRRSQLSSGGGVQRGEDGAWRTEREGLQRGKLGRVPSVLAYWSVALCSPPRSAETAALCHAGPWRVGASTIPIWGAEADEREIRHLTVLQLKQRRLTKKEKKILSDTGFTSTANRRVRSETNCSSFYCVS